MSVAPYTFGMRVLACFLALLPLAAAAQPRGKTYLYTYYDRNGNIVINNLPPSYVQGQGLTLKQVGVGHIRLAISRSDMARVLKSPELLSLVDEIAADIGVDPFLTRAIIQAESAFNYRARSRTGMGAARRSRLPNGRTAWAGKLKFSIPATGPISTTF